ncbi:hypothetical protein [Geobacillus kaustophilus]|nr:hypothetical protein [Geobacillus kaustophilus]
MNQIVSLIIVEELEQEKEEEQASTTFDKESKLFLLIVWSCFFKKN